MTQENGILALHKKISQDIAKYLLRGDLAEELKPWTDGKTVIFDEEFLVNPGNNGHNTCKCSYREEDIRCVYHNSKEDLCESLSLLMSASGKETRLGPHHIDTPTLYDTCRLRRLAELLIDSKQRILEEE